jgi:hypothetical protein
MKKLFFSIASVIAVVSCVSNQETMSELADRVFERAVNQMTLMDTSLSEGEYPRSIDTDGNLVKSNSKWWCCGFYPGSLWYTYEYTGNEQIKALADKYTRSLHIDNVRIDKI